MSGAVGERVAALDGLLAAHAGGLELRDVRDGHVTVAYTGMCTGCPLRPLTTAATVRPALLALPEVLEVDVVGSRISAEAQRRVARALAPATARWSDGSAPPCLPAQG